MKLQDDMQAKIEKTRADMALMDAYWFLANAMDDDKEIPIDKVLVLCQYMLTSYLATIPEQRDIQVQVQQLLLNLLPNGELSDYLSPK